ncbi:uncharacterized protein LOC111828967 [Capsella rubella]|uniref:uncharacterized protein LOC111828967 n=1 Tax=Capsella rubella TaxID=81985 RepID=UPI000CD57461|nr:uncharacterized protein LOC111828967 [Capsella rubella]
MSPPKLTPKSAEALILGEYFPHPPSSITLDDMAGVRFLYGLSSETELLGPGPELSPKIRRTGNAAHMRSSVTGASGESDTLAAEHNYLLTFQDILHLYTIKSGRTMGTFYLNPLSGLRLFDDLPEKDDHWRSGYFFFPVNKDTFGDLQDLFIPHWSPKIGRAARRLDIVLFFAPRLLQTGYFFSFSAALDRGSLSSTLVDHFITLCRSQIAWDSLAVSSNRARVEKAQKFNKGLKAAEIELATAGASLEDSRDKLLRLESYTSRLSKRRRKADEQVALLKAKNVKDLKFDPASFSALLDDTPPDLELGSSYALLMIEEPVADPPTLLAQEFEAGQSELADPLALGTGDKCATQETDARDPPMDPEVN